MARFAADDTLRAALLGVPRERAALGEAVTRLASVAWDEAEDPGTKWVAGIHVSSQAPALAAVLLGDVESEDGAQGSGGVALSPSAVGALVLGMATAVARPSGSGSLLWPVSRATRGVRLSACGPPGHRVPVWLHAALILPPGDRAGRFYMRSRALAWRTATSRSWWRRATRARWTPAPRC